MFLCVQLGAIAISEPEAGSDAFAMRCSASQSGDYYILNGSKTWISNADQAQIFLVMANVDLKQVHHTPLFYLLIYLLYLSKKKFKS